MPGHPKVYTFSLSAADPDRVLKIRVDMRKDIEQPVILLPAGVALLAPNDTGFYARGNWRLWLREWFTRFAWIKELFR